MYLYPFSQLTGADVAALQGASFKQVYSPLQASNTEGGHISPAKGAMNFLSFIVAPHSGMVYTLNRRFSNLRKFISFNYRTRV
ncbi:MAG: hypothetical protein R3B52_02875 [Candidatus Paceibacterota bacterium]